MATVMIALDKCTKENGCLQVLSGSNNIGRIDHALLESGQVGVDLKRVEEDASSEIQLTDAIKLMLQDKDVLGCKYEGIKFDCGSKKGFVAATLYKGLKDESIKQPIKNIIGNP